MDILAVLGVFAVLSYLLYRDTKTPLLAAREGRLCDFVTEGSVYEDIPSALQRGVRLLEVHVYGDEQDHPVIATKPVVDGYDFAEENISFNSCCVSLVNDAFPSKDPMILSMVVHSTKRIVMDRMAEILQTTVRKHLIAAKDFETEPIETFANKLILVSGGDVHGSSLEPLLNFSWSNGNLRRLTFQQAVFSRDEDELLQFNQDMLTMVAPQPEFKGVFANPDKPKALGCQWIVTRHGTPGFLSRA
jgi:hypothetical protein